MKFHKYHALGNDYLVCDREDWPSGFAPNEVALICNRHFGIGADGILWGSDPPPGAEFGLRIYNSDGSEAQKSGNGLRIYCRYLYDLGKVDITPFRVWTVGGVVRAVVAPEASSVTVEMGQVSFDSTKVPVIGPSRELVDEALVIDGEELRVTIATVGNPHCVVLRPRASAQEAKRLGPLIENDRLFPERTNVQFLEIIDRANIRIEIWERGAGYTLASGSSSCAAAAAAHRLGLTGRDINVHMPGGTLHIAIAEDYEVTMTGPVTKVAEGRISRELFDRLSTA